MEVFTHYRFTQYVASILPVLFSSKINSQHSDNLQLPPMRPLKGLCIIFGRLLSVKPQHTSLLVAKQEKNLLALM